jgi:hypothetical protein
MFGNYGGYGMPSVAFATPGGTGMNVPMEVPKAVVRVGEQALWSTQRYPDATALANQQSRVFTTPRGQVGQGFGTALSLAETNLKEGGRVPGSLAFDVIGLAVQPYALTGNTASTLYPVVGADMRNIVSNCVAQWDFTQVVIDIAPLALIGQGGGIFGMTADTGAADGGSGGSRIALNSGNGSLWVYREFPVALPSNATFAILLTWGANAIPVDGGSDAYALCLRAHLIGKFKAAIEIA